MYRVVAVNFDGRAESAPITVTVPAPTAGPGATGYYFNSQFWGEGSYTQFQASGRGHHPRLHRDRAADHLRLRRQLAEAGRHPGRQPLDRLHRQAPRARNRTYGILAFSDDDSYVWVNGQLVSADPGGHGIPGNDPGGIGSIDVRKPIFLTAGQDYNFVAIQSEGGGGSGIFLRWATPSNSGNYVNIPSSAYVSNIPSAAPDKASGAPADITGLAASEVGETRAFLSWNDNSANELRYIVEKADNAAFTGAEVIRLPINARSYSDTALSGGIRYFYRVRAENYFGDSANATVNFQTRASGAGDVVPTAPSNVRARPSNNGVLVTFVDTSGFEDNFLVQRLEADGVTWTDLGTVPLSAGSGTAKSFEDTAPVNPGTNTYRVLAQNSVGNSPPSNTAAVTLPPWGRAPASPPPGSTRCSSAGRASTPPAPSPPKGCSVAGRPTRGSAPTRSPACSKATSSPIRPRLTRSAPPVTTGSPCVSGTR
jgi:hypothetical protein